MVFLWTVGLIVLGFTVANVVSRQTVLRYPQYERPMRIMANVFRTGLVLFALAALLEALGK